MPENAIAIILEKEKTPTKLCKGYRELLKS